MAKDSKGHGSERRTATGAAWDYGKTVGRWGGGVPSNPHPDSAMGRALVKSGQGVQLQLGLTDASAASALANKHPKSAPVPVHGGMRGLRPNPTGPSRRFQPPPEGFK